MRRRVQVVGWTLIWSGVFIFGFLGWQLVGTGVAQAGVQEQASQELAQTFDQASESPPTIERIDPGEYLEEDPDPQDTTVTTTARPAPEFVEFHPEEAPEVGEELAFLRVPKIAVDEVLFEGVDRETLKKGPGHMGRTPLPGQPGNSVISGHRTTYGSPFFDFDLLEPGDLIEVETAIGVHGYEVREIIVVEPTDVWVTDNRPGGWLTLTTCNPKFSARERLIVFAEMVSGPNMQFIDLHRQRFG